MKTIIGNDRLGMFCDVYSEGGKKLARVFQNGYYETANELEIRAIMECEEEL